ncbi:MAG: hypothetical protein Q4C05_02880 [Akkermansia sp.]|nr:hypothetical protein [Akkermansia sp.]
MRAYLEGKNNNHYINIIKKKAQELGVNLRFYNSKDSLARVVNTVRWPNYNFSRRKWEFINATRKGDLRISRFVYFGHGAYGSIVPNYPFKHHGYLGCGTLHNYAFSITGNDIKNGIFRKDVFIKSAIAISCSCRTSGKEKENEESFSSIWASYFGHVMYGLTGRMDYSNPKSPVPSNDPSAPSQWTPSNPFE